MIIECPYCESKVDGIILAENTAVSSPEDGSMQFKALLLKCPICEESLLAGQDLVEISLDEYEWDSPSRLWPEPKKHFDQNVPDRVRKLLIEAEKCYKCTAYQSCAIMCGKVLEGICLEFKAKKYKLEDKLKELLESKIIDDKIYEWGETLRKQRNIGAHNFEKNILKEDARDLLDFSIAICDYIFVLTKKFDDFIKRINSKK